MKLPYCGEAYRLKKKPVVNFVQRGNVFQFYGEKEIFAAISACKDKILSHTSWYWH
jgi:hypothetical protein